jgi:hypothetical protein
LQAEPERIVLFAPDAYDGALLLLQQKCFLTLYAQRSTDETSSVV